jgi:hypothetical protein
LAESALAGHGAVGLAAAAAIGLVPRRWGALVGAGAAGTIAYLLVASAPWHPARPAALAIALGGAIFVQPRGRRGHLLMIGAALGASVLGSVLVLRRSGWQAEAGHLVELATGLLAGATVTAWLWRAADLSALDRQWTPQRIAALAALVVACASMALGRPARLPAWAAIARRIPAPPPGIAGRDAPEVIEALELLRAARVRDAVDAWVALALRENADAEAVRQACQPGGRSGVLAEPWVPQIAVGELACRATRMRAEDGAAFLDERAAGAPVSSTLHGPAVLTRLAADLWLEAARLDQAERTAVRASELGDAFALRDLVRGLLDRGHRDRALEVADVSDPLVRVWLELPLDENEAWRVWNASLDFDSLASPTRSGVSSLGSTGRFLSRWDDERDRRFYAALSPIPAHAASRLPLPPGRTMPASLTLQFASAFSLKISLTNDRGQRLVYGCPREEEVDDRKILRLPLAACRGAWSEVTIWPAGRLTGHVEELSIHGTYSLERIEGEARVP